MYSKVAEGLKMLFWANIVMIFAGLLSIIPIIGIIGIVGVVICLIISLIGLYRAGTEVDGYKTAFILNIVNIIFTMLESVDGTFGDAMSIVSSIITLAVTYYIIITTSEVMRNVGAYDVADYGNNVWSIYLVCTVISIVFSLLAILPVISILAKIGLFVVAIVQIVADIKYLIYVHKSYTTLGA